MEIREYGYDEPLVLRPHRLRQRLLDGGVNVTPGLLRGARQELDQLLDHGELGGVLDHRAHNLLAVLLVLKKKKGFS